MRVHRQALHPCELAVLRAGRSPLPDETAVLVELRDAIRVADAVRDVDVAGPIPRDIRRTVERRAGNIYIADGIGNTNRIAKFDKSGNFIRQWGSTGSGNGQFAGVKSLAVDAQGNVYAADIGNKRIQVFDADGNFKSQFGNIGTPLTLCMTTGATQYLYVSHSGDPDGMEDAAIYKVQLDGRVVGKFGSAGKLPKQFGLANSIDCRNENELLVGEVTNWRVQKVTLRAAR